MIDMPILRDADDDAGLYAAVAPTNAAASFPGCVLYKSIDDVTLENVLTITARATFGVAYTALASGPVGVFDEGHKVRVVVNGALSSVSRDAILNGTTNAFWFGNGEVLQARDCTLVAANTYDLTGLLRGLRGTEWAIGTHAAGERVVLLNTAIRRVPLSASEIGAPRYWRAVTLGRTTATASSQSFTNTAIGKKPFAPVDVRVARDASNNITITWQRRSRLATQLISPSGIVCPLGEESESYSVDIYTTSGYTTVVRTISATSASAAYSAADQTTDFGSAQATIYIKVYQLSAVVGRGTAANAQG